MDLLRSSYASSDDESDDEKTKQQHISTKPLDPSSLRQSVQSKVSAAPYVMTTSSSSTALSLSTKKRGRAVKEEEIVLYHNPKASDLYAPMCGPQNPNTGNVMYDESGQEAVSGVATSYEVDSAAFHRMYHKKASAQNPFRKKSAIVDLGPSKAIQALRAAEDEPAKKKKRLDGLSKAERRNVRKEMYLEKGKHDEEGGSWNSIWAVRDEEVVNEDEKDEDEEEEKTSEDDGEKKITLRRDEEEEEARREAMKFTKGEGPSVPYSKGISKSNVKSVFHGDAETDYQGRSWNTPPSDLRPLDEDDQAKMKCFLPKKRVHTFTGHTKGVRKIDLIPRYGHLLLSGSFDSKCKIWDVKKRRCMRTCMGHSQGVNDVQFSNDGDCFLSSSLDRHIKLWDTETGKCRIDLTNHKIPYCVKFYPENNNLVLAGCSNKKIVQYDCRTCCVFTLLYHSHTHSRMTLNKMHGVNIQVREISFKSTIII